MGPTSRSTDGLRRGRHRAGGLFGCLLALGLLSACSPPTKTFLVPDSVEPGALFVEINRPGSPDLPRELPGEIVFNANSYACLSGELMPKYVAPWGPSCAPPTRFDEEGEALRNAP